MATNGSQDYEQLRAEVIRLQAAAVVQAEQREEQLRELEASNSQLRNWEAEKEAVEQSIATHTAELEVLKAVYEQRLQDRFREIARLTQIVREREQALSHVQGQAEWMRRTLSIFTNNFSRSRKARLAAWLPAYFMQKRMKSLLIHNDLFDPLAYLKRYPDVSEKKIDPLRHYINDGMREGRVIK